MDKACLSAAALLLLLPWSEAAALLTEAPPSNVSLATHAINGSVEVPQVLRSHRSCSSEHVNYCENGGQCMYPQDSDTPSCICTSSYGGPRCLFFIATTQSSQELEQLIGVSLGVLLLLAVVAAIFYCCAYKRCVKAAPMKTPAASESTA